MSILINKDTKLVVQGITGRDGGFHAEKMMEYGTNYRSWCFSGQRRSGS